MAKFSEMTGKAEQLVESGNAAKKEVQSCTARVSAASAQLKSAQRNLDSARESDEDGKPKGNVSSAQSAVAVAQGKLAASRRALQDAKNKVAQIDAQKKTQIRKIESHNSIEKNNLTQLKKLQGMTFAGNVEKLYAGIAERINQAEKAKAALRQSLGLEDDIEEVSTNENFSDFNYTNDTDIGRILSGINNNYGGFSTSENYSGINHREGGISADVNGYTHKMNAADVTYFWQQGTKTNSEIIEGYREELNDLGIPNGEWLDKELATHLNGMNERLAAELDMASGHKSNVDLNDIYPDVGDFKPFFKEIKQKFDEHCKADVNPHFGEGNQWGENCQRCVPTYEHLKRGSLGTAKPLPQGHDYLSYHPFDVWQNPIVHNTSGDGMEDIKRTMASWGDGARAQIVVNWDGPLGGGHTFIAEQINGNTVFIDPQTYISRNDPGYTQPEDYFKSVVSNQTRFCRIDNLGYSGYIKECYMEAK